MRSYDTQMQMVSDVHALIVSDKTPLYTLAVKAFENKVHGQPLRKLIWGSAAYDAARGWNDGKVRPTFETIKNLCDARNDFVRKHLTDQHGIEPNLETEDLAIDVPRFNFAIKFGYRGYDDPNRGWVWEYNKQHRCFEWELAERDINEVLFRMPSETRPYNNTNIQCNHMWGMLSPVCKVYTFSFKPRAQNGGTVFLESSMYIKQPVLFSEAQELFQIPLQTGVLTPNGQVALYDGKLGSETDINVSMTNGEHRDKVEVILQYSDHETYLSGLFIHRSFTGVLVGDVIVVEPLSVDTDPHSSPPSKDQTAPHGQPKKIDISTPESVCDFLMKNPKKHDSIDDADISDDLREYIKYKHKRLRQLLA